MQTVRRHNGIQLLLVVRGRILTDVAVWRVESRDFVYLVVREDKDDSIEEIHWDRLVL